MIEFKAHPASDWESWLFLYTEAFPGIVVGFLFVNSHRNSMHFCSSLLVQEPS